MDILDESQVITRLILNFFCLDQFIDVNVAKWVFVLKISSFGPVILSYNFTNAFSIQLYGQNSSYIS